MSMPYNGILIRYVYGIRGQEVMRHINHNGSDAVTAVDREQGIGEGAGMGICLTLIGYTRAIAHKELDGLVVSGEIGDIELIDTIVSKYCRVLLFYRGVTVSTIGMSSPCERFIGLTKHGVGNKKIGRMHIDHVLIGAIAAIRVLMGIEIGTGLGDGLSMPMFHLFVGYMYGIRCEEMGCILNRHSQDAITAGLGDERIFKHRRCRIFHPTIHNTCPVTEV